MPAPSLHRPCNEGGTLYTSCKYAEFALTDGDLIAVPQQALDLYVIHYIAILGYHTCPVMLRVSVPSAMKAGELALEISSCPSVTGGPQGRMVLGGVSPFYLVIQQVSQLLHVF